MGNQQLILLVLGTIVVAVAMAVGISQFRAYQVETGGDEMQSTIIQIATEAKTHYDKPKALGGGGGTFDGFQLPSQIPKSAGVTYTLHPVIGHPSLAIIGANESGKITAMFGADHGQFRIVWVGQQAYRNRSVAARPFR